MNVNPKNHKMTKKRALNVLEIFENNPSNEIIKKQYRILALKYHPDKNKTIDACSKFQELNEAYKFFEKKTAMYEGDTSTEEEESMKETSNYQTILFFFLKTLFYREANSRALFEIIRNLVTTCEDKSLALLSKIDKTLLFKIFEIMKTYGDLLHLTPSYIEKVEEMVKMKLSNDERIILHPFLDDLFNNNVYKLTINDENYFVPLWHHELIYDCSGGELFVECVPILPENVSIDDKNNIHVHISYDICDIWKEENITFWLGNKKLSFPKNQLYMEETQCRLLVNQGITFINTEDVYDISRKTDIYVYIEIHSAVQN